MATITASHSEKTSLTFEDHEVQVLVDGKEVAHYGIESNEEKKEFSCWVASEAGKASFDYYYPISWLNLLTIRIPVK